MSEKCLIELSAQILESRTSLAVLGFKNGNKLPTAQQVKDLYRKLVLLVHPDKNDSPNASECFVRLKLAYDEIIGSLDMPQTRKEVPRKRAHPDVCSNNEDNLRSFEEMFCDEDILRHAENWKRFRSGDAQAASVEEAIPDTSTSSIQHSAVGTEDRSTQDHDKTVAFVCLLCQRQFTCAAHLDKHVALSALHKLNLSKTGDNVGIL